jgi:hypothetical protein
MQLSKKVKAFGVLFFLLAGVCFAVNFHIFNPWLIGGIVWLWNPLSLITPAIVKYLPSDLFFVNGSAVSGSIALLLNYLFAGLYSVLLLFIGKTMLFHKSKQPFPIQQLTPYP